jgi:hypothetical protein
MTQRMWGERFCLNALSPSSSLSPLLLSFKNLACNSTLPARCLILYNYIFKCGSLNQPTFRSSRLHLYYLETEHGIE